MARIEFERVTKRFGEVVAVEEFTLDVVDGEFLVLVGPSGSGKSTVLRMLAGLEEISSGEIRIAGQSVNDVAAKNRDIAMVFQSYALYPHMSVFDNMAFALKLRGIPKDEIRRRVEAAAEMLDLDALLKRKPRQLSGGQRQRVALGRAIVREPAAFLLDEPLSNLDAQLRVQTRAEITQLHHRLGTTFVYVTHDQVEAMTMASRIAVLDRGILQQAGTPTELYERPVNMFVAGFIGSPSMNFFQVAVGEVAESTIRLRNADVDIELPREVVPQLATREGQPIVLGIRPEHIHGLGHAPQDVRPVPLSGVVRTAEVMGSETVLHLDRGQTRLLARVDPRIRTRVGEETPLVIDASHVYAFDPDSHEALLVEGSAQGG